ncbi:MAG: ATP-dependent metallopeptidase FtsH/Yme1/Tma family protein, partial [Desulfobacterales bacterium]|nr:ATP-dependent metallopeptidase FtsH/Yme1/Tma family protein [Desulfobacterales bacterium]
MEKKYKFSIWYILLGIWVVFLIQSVLSSAFAVRTIPYSEFLNLLKANQITEVAISANRIQGKMNVDGREQMFKTVRVDPDISALLEQHNVTFKGQMESTVLRDLFSWIFPIILFVGIWYFLIRRMAGSQTGFMTLGKNKAKIYMENEIKVTFKDAAGVDEAEQELVEVIEFLKEPAKFTQLGGKLPKGILLVGP